ncbi:hypothetical protein TIFTF001_021657 [Ficus carica]|uniref:VWFA domain-containing protein n=1 Tax=Ficus carica TaxID=3494 RepID=A0AA88AH54_FICCA|nr:hypothetical protein TIFTF001_021657 [Ficus carica]
MLSGEKPKAYKPEKTPLKVIHKSEAPLEETELKVLLELTGSGDNEDRSPLDLVAVLDVSGSMNDAEKIGKLKIAMQFLVRKLSPVDRLSVVTFSHDSTRLFPLRQITEKSQEDIIKQVNALDAVGGTNIAAGLEMGVEVLNDRRFKDSRVGAIMLMSDGDQNIGDACQVQVGNFAVHTFGFGQDMKPDVLNDIANKSKGGTFSVVGESNDLSKAFAQCLGGLLTVLVQDLNLTITQVDNQSKINNVSAGKYPKTETNRSVTILFGELYNNEVRRVLVDLRLPKVGRRKSKQVLQVTYTYSAGKEKRPMKAPLTTVIVTRTGKVMDKEIPKVILEENRLKTLNSVKEARLVADNELKKVENKVVEAIYSLKFVNVDDPSQLIKTLIYELQHISDYTRTENDYKKKGIPYAMSLETSHERQRYATRGDDMEKVRTFATPRMDTYLEQFNKFEKDPTKPPPSVEDDVKQEHIDDVERERVDDPHTPCCTMIVWCIIM